MKLKIFRRMLALCLLACLCLTALAAEPGLSNFQKTQTYADAFLDVHSYDWFYENIKSVNELGLMIGKSTTRFDTESNMTVAEAMTIAARLHAIYQTGSGEFTQSQPWYQVYTDYCKDNGIADPAAYDLSLPVTRAQFAVIFANALPAEALEAINEIEDDAIPDVKSDEACAEAVYRLYRAGILTGNDEKGSFAPGSSIRRSEAAAIVTRMALPELRKSLTLTAVIEVDGVDPAPGEEAGGETSPEESSVIETEEEQTAEDEIIEEEPPIDI